MDFSHIEEALQSQNIEQQKLAITALEEWVQTTTWQDSTAQAPQLLPGLLHVWNQVPKKADWSERDPFAGGWPYIPVESEFQAPLSQRVLSIMAHVGRPSDVSELLDHPHASRQSGLWVHTLARIGGHQALPQLCSRLQTSTSTHETLLFLQCLELLPDPRNLEQLQRYWNHSNPAVRAHALRALRALGKDGTKQLPHILPLLHDSAVRVREQAVLTVGVLGSSDVLSKVLPQLHDHEPSVRCCTLQAVRQIDATAVVEAIPTLCKDPSHHVQQEVLLCLMKLGQLGYDTHKSVAYILPWLTGSDTTLAETTAECLGLLDYKPAQRELLSLVRVPYYDASLRAASVKALGTIASPADTETRRVLLRMMKFPNPRVQRAAAAVLTSWNQTEIQPLLVRWLEHSNPWLQMQAVQSLHQMDPITFLPKLLNKLQIASHEQAETIVNTIAQSSYPSEETAMLQDVLGSLLHTSRPDLRQNLLLAYHQHASFNYALLTPWLDALQHTTEQLLSLYYWGDNLPRITGNMMDLFSMVQASLEQDLLDLQDPQYSLLQEQLLHTQESIRFVQEKAGHVAQSYLEQLQHNLHTLLDSEGSPYHQQWEATLEDSLFL